MGYVTREMIDRAKKMDLLTYLQTYEPQELVHFGGNTYCTREHDSLKISNGKWCWFSRGIGGKTALDYLIKVKELPFTEAVERIVGRMLCVFESSIVLLSYATMAQAGGLSWRSQHLLSLAGVYKPQKETQEHRLPLALTQYLKDHAEIKTICLCLDNDMTGRSATEAIRQQLAERYKVASAFPRQGKDYNDWLCIRMGLQPAKENPMTERSFAR